MSKQDLQKEQKVVLVFSGGADTTYCVKIFYRRKRIKYTCNCKHRRLLAEEELKKIEAHALSRLG